MALRPMRFEVCCSEVLGQTLEKAHLRRLQTLLQEVFKFKPSVSTREGRTCKGHRISWKGNSGFRAFAQMWQVRQEIRYKGHFDLPPKAAHSREICIIAQGGV